MEHMRHTQGQRTTSARTRVVPATSSEVALLFPALFGLLLLAILLL